MALSCLLRNSLKQLSPLKTVALWNQIKLSSCINNLPTFTSSKPSICNTNLSQLDIIKKFSTSPVSKSAHGDHSKIWTAERALSGALLGILPAAMLIPCQLLDTLMAMAIVMHMHWGIEAVVVDYVRPIIFGPVIPKLGVIFVYCLSIATLAGLLNFIFNDVGIANGIRLMWKL